MANQHFCNAARKENASDTGFRFGRFENASDTGFRFGRFENAYSFVEFALGREDKNNFFSVKSFNSFLCSAG